MPTTPTNPVTDKAERELVEALSAYIDTVADDIRIRAAQQASLAKSGLDRLAEEYDGPDPLVQALIEDARQDYDRVPEFFAAVTKSVLERELEPLRQPPIEEAPVIEGSVIVVDVDEPGAEINSRDKGDSHE